MYLNDWKWQEMAGHYRNIPKWLETAKNGLKLLEMEKKNMEIT